MNFGILLVVKCFPLMRYLVLLVTWIATNCSIVSRGLLTKDLSLEFLMVCSFSGGAHGRVSATDSYLVEIAQKDEQF